MFNYHMQEVLRGAAAAFSAKVIGAGASFLVSLVIARNLGAEGAGIYYLAVTVGTVAAVFGRFGLDNALLRFVAESASAENWGQLKSVARQGILLSSFVSLAATATVGISAPWLAAVVFGKPELVEPVRWMSLAIFPIVQFTLHAELLKGIKRILLSQLVQGAGLPLFTLVGLWTWRDDLQVLTAVGVYVTAAAVTAFVAISVWHFLARFPEVPPHPFPTTRLLSSSLPLFWVSLMYLLLNWFSTLVLGVWATKEEVGIFSVAMRAAMLTSFVLVAVNSIVAPKFAALYTQGDRAGLESTARQSTLLMGVLATPFLILFLLFPGPVLRLFGPEFAIGNTCLGILAVGQFINVASGPVGYLLIMSGHEIIMRNITLFVASMTVLLNLLLVPRWGMNGAAVATAANLAATNLFAYFYAWKRLGIWTFPVKPKRFEAL